MLLTSLLTLVPKVYWIFVNSNVNKTKYGYANEAIKTVNYTERSIMVLLYLINSQTILST